MDLAYMTQFTPDDQVYREVDGESESFGMEEGGSWPLEGSYCQRMVLGQIPNAVSDTSAESEVRDLELTEKAGIGAYVGRPDHALRRHALRDDLHDEPRSGPRARRARRPVHARARADHRRPARADAPGRGEREPARPGRGAQGRGRPEGPPASRSTRSPAATGSATSPSAPRGSAAPPASAAEEPDG